MMDEKQTRTTDDRAGGVDPAERAVDAPDRFGEERRARAARDADDPERIRDEIGRTRGRMDDTLDALEYRVAPSRVAERGRARLRSRWDRVRTSVMGSADTGTSSAGAGSSGRNPREVASDAADQARQAPQQVKQRTRGNPLAAGMIAFGAGVLVSSLLSETEQEQRLVEDAAGRVDLDRVRDEAEQVVVDVREPVQARAREGAEDLKGTAKEHAQGMKEEATASKDRVASDDDLASSGRGDRRTR